MLALAVAPAGAEAGVTARAGVLYSRYDGWPQVGAQVTQPHFDVDLGLDARGVIVSRDVADYSLQANWGRISDETAGATATTTSLSYSGQATFLNNEVSPVTASVFASRGETDFATSTSPDAFGRGVANTAGASVSLKSASLPAVNAGYSWSEAESSIAGQPLRTTTSQTLSSSLQLGTPTFSVNASYGGEFRDGSWTSDNYQIHNATVAATTFVGRQVLSLNAGSTMTLPGELGPGMFEQQTTAFSAFLNAQGTRLRRTFSYRYGHTLVESPAAPTNEITRQGVRYEGDHFVTGKTFTTRWLLDASYAETRCEAVSATCGESPLSGGFEETQLRTTGETLGVSLFWRRILPSSTLEVHAGPRVALLQSELEETGQEPVRSESGGYGAAAGANFSRPLGRHTLQADYNGNFGQDLFATAGWQLTQSLGAALSGPAATARYNASLRASAFRTHSPVSGDGAGRTLGASATLATRRVSLNGRASLSSGIVGSTPEQFVGDGLLLPAPFDSTVIDVSVGGQFKPLAGLTASLNLHLGRSDIPGRPVLHENSAVGAVTYTFAAIAMGVENRLTRAETATGWDVTNVVMFRVYRSFRW
jgi:hypothetical protein